MIIGSSDQVVRCVVVANLSREIMVSWAVFGFGRGRGDLFASSLPLFCVLHPTLRLLHWTQTSLAFALGGSEAVCFRIRGSEAGERGREGRRSWRMNSTIVPKVL